jgi:hypothetical protein
MNQRADSRKKNLAAIVARQLIVQRRWLLSHTLRRSKSENRKNGIEMTLAGVDARSFFPLTST